MNGFIYGSDTNGTQKLSTGINLSETSVSGGSGTSYGIVLRDITVTRYKATGITGTAINDLSLENCVSNDGTNSSSGNVVGTALTTINNLLITNCEFSNNSASSGYCEGLKLVDCIDGNITAVQASGNQSTTSYVTGIALDYTSTGCKNLQFTTTNCCNNTTASGIAIGFSITDSTLISLRDCKANSNSSSAVDGVSGISLFDILATSDNCSLVNIEANQNTGTAYTSYGVYIESNNNFLHNVTASSNTTAANNSVAGIFLNGSNDNTLLDCTTNNNSNSNTSASSAASCYGIALSSSSNNRCINCKAFGNSTTAAAAVRAIGIYTTAGTDNSFEHCIASGNTASSTTAGVIAAGFEFNSTETRSKLVNCEAAHNLVGNGTTSNATARVYGIYFSGSSSGATDCTVLNCTITNNSRGSSGSGKAFGFYDNKSSSSSLIIGNIATGHGQTLGGTLDASLQWNNNSEPSSSQNYFFKHSGTDDDPRNVIQEIPRHNLKSISTAVRKWQSISIY